MRENRTSGSEGGEAQINELSLPLSPLSSRILTPAVLMSEQQAIVTPKPGIGAVLTHQGSEHKIPISVPPDSDLEGSVWNC